MSLLLMTAPADFSIRMCGETWKCKGGSAGVRPFNGAFIRVLQKLHIDFGVICLQLQPFKSKGIKMRNITALVGLVALSACAAGPTMQETRAEPVAANMSRITVYRPSVMGTAIQPIVYLNGAPTQRCKPRGAFTVDVPKGVHRISATTEVEKAVSIDTTNASQAYVKCSIGFGVLAGRPHFEVVDAKVGKAESSGLARVTQ